MRQTKKTTLNDLLKGLEKRNSEILMNRAYSVENEQRLRVNLNA